MVNLSIQPELKKRIEKLLIWLIPFFVVSALTPQILLPMIKNAIDQSITGAEPIRLGLQGILHFIQFVGQLDNLIVAIWFYPLARDYKFNKYLWPLFAFISPYISLMIFLFLVLFQYGEEPSNQTLKADEK